MRQLPRIRLFAAMALGAVLVPQAWAAPTPADQSFTAASQFYEMQLDQQATVELNRFVTAFPTDPRVHQAAYMLGYSYQRQRQFDKALEAYGRVINAAVGPALAPLRAEAHYQMGECYFLQKQYDRAVRSYGFCLKLAGANTDLIARAQYWSGESLYQLNKYNEAIEAYRAMIKVAPGHSLAPWASYSVGMIALRQQDYATAIPALEQVTTKHKDSEMAGEALLALGYAYAGRARAAKDALGKVADFQRAADVFTAVQASAKTPASAKQKAALALGQVYFESNDFDKSEAAFGQAIAGIELGSQALAQTRLWRAHALYNGKRYQEAAAEYGKVAESKFADLAVDGLYWQANSLYQAATTNKEATAYSEATPVFRKFLTVAGDKHAQASHAALLLAFCYEDLTVGGDTSALPKAITAFKDVMAKWPNSREAVQAQAGITRLTATMTPEDLKKLVGSLPAGAASWSVTLRLAREEFQANRYETAVEAARKALEGNPGADVATQANYLLAASLQKLNRLEEAIPIYQQVLEAAPTGELAPFAARGLAQANLDTRRYPEAKAAAITLLKLLPEAEKAEALMYQAEASLGSQAYADALAAYQQVVASYPDSPLVPKALMGVAWVAETKKDRALAVTTYRQFIARFPQHESAPEAQYRLGVNLTQQKEYAAAIESFKAVPATHKLAVNAAYDTAWAYVDLGQREDAKGQFLRVADTFPKDPMAADSLARIGEFLMEEKNYTEGQRIFARALELAGTSGLAPMIAYKLGVCAYYAGDNQAAVDAFSRVGQKYATSEYAADSTFWRGQALEKLGQAAPARDAFVQYIAKFATQGLVIDAMTGAGRTAVGLGKFEDARTDLRKALALCEKANAGTDKVLIERAKNVAPEAQFFLGESYFGEKKYADALKEYANVSAYQYEPWYSRSLLQMARCSALQGDKAAAERTLQMLVRIFPQDEVKKQAAAVAKDYTLDFTP